MELNITQPGTDDEGAAENEVNGLEVNDDHTMTQPINLWDMREALWEKLEATTNFGTWAWNIQEQQITWSTRLYQMLGLQNDLVGEALGETFLKRIHPDDQAAYAQGRLDAFAGQDPAPISFHYAHPAKRWVHLIQICSRIQSPDGELVGFVGALQDITDRKHHEHQQNNSRRVLKNAQKLAQMGSWEWNPHTQEVVWSDQIYTILGLGHHITPDAQRFIDAIHPDDRDAFLAAFNTFRDVQPEETHYQCRIIRPNGEVRRIMSVSLASDGQENAMGIMMDITDLEGENSPDERAQHLKSVGQLAGGVAHDFNNMLTVILGNAEILRMQFPDNQMIAQIIAAAESGAKLTRELTLFSKEAQAVPEFLGGRSDS